jgi:hypothetical protein
MLRVHYAAAPRHCPPRARASLRPKCAGSPSCRASADDGFHCVCRAARETDRRDNSLDDASERSKGRPEGAGSHRRPTRGPSSVAPRANARTFRARRSCLRPQARATRPARSAPCPSPRPSAGDRRRSVARGNVGNNCRNACIRNAGDGGHGPRRPDYREALAASTQFSTGERSGVGSVLGDTDARPSRARSRFRLSSRAELQTRPNQGRYVHRPGAVRAAICPFAGSSITRRLLINSARPEGCAARSYRTCARDEQPRSRSVV